MHSEEERPASIHQGMPEATGEPGRREAGNAVSLSLTARGRKQPRQRFDVPLPGSRTVAQPQEDFRNPQAPPPAGPASPPAHPGPAPAVRLTCRVQPKTPIMSIATVRYSASTSHQGLSTLKAGCCSVNCLNSATGIIFPAGEGQAGVAETLKRGRLVVGPQRAGHLPLLPICLLVCPSLAERTSCVPPSPLPRTSPPSWSQATTVLPTSAPGDPCSHLTLLALSEVGTGSPQGLCPPAGPCGALPECSRRPPSMQSPKRSLCGSDSRHPAPALSATGPERV